MRIIEALTNQIAAELDDAQKYADDALLQKDSDKALAAAYHALAGKELDHAHVLHEHAVRLISAYRAEHGEPPAPMMALYNDRHKAMIDKEADVKRRMEMYSG